MAKIIPQMVGVKTFKSLQNAGITDTNQLVGNPGQFLKIPYMGIKTLKKLQLYNEPEFIDMGHVVAIVRGDGEITAVLKEKLREFLDENP